MKRFIIWVSLLLITIPTIFGQIPAGYYNAATGLTGNNLRSALKTITTTGHVKLSYTPGVWNAYAYTDVRPAPNNTIVWDMYSDKPNGTPDYTFTIVNNQCLGGSSYEGYCYSREHSLPNSWWGGYDDDAHPQYSDLHHLFPADQYVNQKKSNHPIGQTNTPTDSSSNGCKIGPCTFPGYTGVIFEPINEYKGDFARAYFYLATRYMDNIGLWVKNYNNYESKYIIDTATSNYKQWFVDMLISWHNADPVSTKEINRNNAIYYNTAQHNRNPFIDHPEYVQAIWGGLSLSAEPTNYPADFAARNIHLQWTDAIGSVVPEHYLIRMSTIGFSSIETPVDGVYYPDGATDLNVNYGVQNAWFKNLSADTTYYFKLFGYKGSGTNTNYKTSGSVPQISKKVK
jgi:endonuclease I